VPLAAARRSAGIALDFCPGLKQSGSRARWWRSRMHEEIECEGYVGEIVSWGTEYPLESKGTLGITDKRLHLYKGHNIRFKLTILEDLGVDPNKPLKSAPKGKKRA